MTYVPNQGYSFELTLGTAVADDGTVTVDYPSGSSQLTFNAGNYKEGAGNVMLNDNDKLSDADPGVSFTFGASNITLTNLSGASWAAGTKIRGWLPVWATQPVFLSFHLDLASITAADVVTNIRPGVAGYITHMEFVADKVVTTASKLATLNAEIDTTNLTGGTIALTSAALTPKGARVASSRITGANRLVRESTLSIEASSVTQFAEGTGNLIIKIQPDVL